MSELSEHSLMGNSINLKMYRMYCGIFDIVNPRFFICRLNNLASPIG